MRGRSYASRVRAAVGIPLLLAAVASGATAADIGVYFDTAGTQTTLQAQPFATIQWYVVASNVAGGMNAYAFAVEVDSRITVTGRQMDPATSLNMGQGDDWTVGIGQCVPASSPTTLLLYQGMLLAAADNVPIRLGALVTDYPEGPVYNLCEGAGTQAFDTVTGALLNPAEKSWGALKGLYEGQ